MAATVRLICLISRGDDRPTIARLMQCLTVAYPDEEQGLQTQTLGTKFKKKHFQKLRELVFA